MIEILFTQEEIQEILFESQKPEYQDPYLWHLGSKKTSVNEVSNESGLVLAYGNEHTGWKHISERHSLTSRKPYWNEKGKIDNPTKLPLGTTPRDCFKLALQIFTPKNRTISKRPDDFDLYTGSCVTRKGKSHECALLTYKGTGVIHSFFITENHKPYNKEKILNLRQGWSSGSHNLQSCIQNITIPYYDAANNVRYVVIVRNLEVEGIEKWYIQVNTEDGTPYLTTFIEEKPLKQRMDIGDRTVHVDFSNITWIEKIIKRIQDGKYIF